MVKKRLQTLILRNSRGEWEIAKNIHSLVNTKDIFEFMERRRQVKNNREKYEILHKEIRIKM